MAQWITRLTTDQKIPGSNPGRFVNHFRNILRAIHPQKIQEEGCTHSKGLRACTLAWPHLHKDDRNALCLVGWCPGLVPPPRPVPWKDHVRWWGLVCHLGYQGARGASCLPRPFRGCQWRAPCSSHNLPYEQSDADCSGDKSAALYIDFMGPLGT